MGGQEGGSLHNQESQNPRLGAGTSSKSQPHLVWLLGWPQDDRSKEQPMAVCCPCGAGTSFLHWLVQDLAPSWLQGRVCRCLDQRPWACCTRAVCLSAGAPYWSPVDLPVCQISWVPASRAAFLNLCGTRGKLPAFLNCVREISDTGASPRTSFQETLLWTIALLGQIWPA